MMIQTVKPLLIKVAIIVLITALTPMYCSPYCQQQSSLRQRDERLPIRLRLKIKKRTYPVGEPIEINVYLENVSDDRWYYVGRDIDGIYNLTKWFHSVKLMVIDEHGKSITLPQGASVESVPVLVVNGKPMPAHRPTIAEMLAKEYINLAPGAFYGFRDEVVVTYENVRDWHLRPGRYRLQAKYQETEALSWAEAERKSLETPVWEQPLSSNVVVLRVIPK